MSLRPLVPEISHKCSLRRSIDLYNFPKTGIDPVTHISSWNLRTKLRESAVDVNGPYGTTTTTTPPPPPPDQHCYY
uniref:Uncharacterized protein n=1 Tax=Vespula pensylvanica TaxID=30213 RepID=A0A834KJK3_VESPE|nr:hypothetical protein H0235_014722 [Vespula pensylvanica]